MKTATPYLLAVSFSVAASFFAGMISWCFCPPEPRMTIRDTCDRVVFSPDGSSFVTVDGLSSGNATTQPRFRIRLWDINSHEEKLLIESSTQFIENVAFSQDGQKVAMFGRDVETLVKRLRTSRIRVWNAKTGKVEQAITSDDFEGLKNASGVFFSGKGGLMIFRRSDLLLSYDILDAVERKLVRTNETLPSWFLMKPGEDLPTDIWPETKRITKHIAGNWEIPLRACYPPIHRGGPQILDQIDVSSNGKILARGGSNDTLEIWNSENAKKKDLKLPFLIWGPTTIRLSLKGNRVLVGGSLIPEKTHSIIDRVTEWLRPSKPVPFSAQMFLESRDDFWLYDTTTGEELAHFPDVSDAFLSPDGKTVAAVRDDRIELWNIPVARPWLKIVGVAVITGLVVSFFLGSIKLCVRRRQILKKKKLANIIGES